MHFSVIQFFVGTQSILPTCLKPKCPFKIKVILFYNHRSTVNHRENLTQVLHVQFLDDFTFRPFAVVFGFDFYPFFLQLHLFFICHFLAMRCRNVFNIIFKVKQKCSQAQFKVVRLDAEMLNVVLGRGLAGPLSLLEVDAASGMTHCKTNTECYICLSPSSIKVKIIRFVLVSQNRS
uniref:Uncharacterized protein n=1 Tax=Rousettus aegyptiacus TaxID=9407 RepID=A0A7J8DIK9_ROUAE|nr:hypothetical protein HJG63_008626 [Rousettus aegyptiacus]